MRLFMAACRTDADARRSGTASATHAATPCTALSHTFSLAFTHSISTCHNSLPALLVLSVLLCRNM